MNIRSKVWGILVDLYPRYLRWRYGMDIGKIAEFHGKLI